MALVTIQRSPSISGSISSSSESGGLREEENSKVSKSLNECYFAGKGAALMLGSNERLRTIDGRRVSQIPNELSASQISTGSVGNDIQQHLQSMFYLLRPEETLKMAVKLESLRAGRTRYLVVVSRPVSKVKTVPQGQQQSQQVPVDFNNASNMTTKPSTHDNSSQLNSEIVHEPCSINETNPNRNTQNYFNDFSGLADFKKINIDKNNNSNNNKMNCDEKIEIMLTKDRNDDENRVFSDNFLLNELNSNVKLNDSENNSKKSATNCNELEESCLLGIDCNEKTTVGLVLKVLADTTIRLDGDGGFSVSVCGRQHIFKPVSVQAMWSALQTLHKVSSKAREHNFFAGGSSHEWVQYYEDHIESDRSCLNEWHAMDSLESRRPPSPDTIRTKPGQREETERVIRTALKEIMMSVDLDEVTSKYIRSRLEEHLDMDLGEFKSFIDEEMLVILGQMDAPTEIFDHVYLGSEWNASNLEELQRNGVRHILNVTREIDNFFPGMFDYFNVRVYDDDKTDLLKHWDNTFKYISRAKMEGSKVLVHCKMGISRSASVVVAYAMKAYNWDFKQAIKHVKEKRTCIKPNQNFIEQLETYQGILDAMKNKEKLQRSKSETSLKCNENTKDGKSLPGSEPTPLIQALQYSRNTYPSSKKEESQKQQRIYQRPSSWSPECVKSSDDISVATVSQNKCQSLKNLAALESEPDELICETTNMRLPCKNGQNFSITQNKILFLENHQVPFPFVKSIVNELEMKTKDDENDETIEKQVREEESWDPGEKMSVDFDTTEVKTVWTCSAEIIHQEQFQNDGEKKEEPKQLNVLNVEVSRQSSWSSVDSACVMQRESPSRNSSWGSGDNRQAPSRNSSWSSYDMKNQTDDVNMGQSGIFPYDKDEIPWHPGTVKRTKQKIEEKSDAKNMNQKILCDIKKSLLIDSLSNLQKNNKKLQEKSAPVTVTLRATTYKSHERCKSEEMIMQCPKSATNQLSASAPSEFSMNFMNSNDVIMQSSKCGMKLHQRRQNQLRKHSASIDEPADKKSNKNKDNSSTQSQIGKLKNLKMYFESKATVTGSSGEETKNCHCQSMPSSPVAIHIDVNTGECENDKTEDTNVKGLVNKYEVTKRGHVKHDSLGNNATNTGFIRQQRPKSMMETKSTSKHNNNNNQPLMLTHSTILKSDDFGRPPPIPSQMPVVKNALFSSNNTFQINALNQKQNTANVTRKKQQGNTHPLSKLGFNKQRLNTTPAYNTM